jgi:hypothetical protein
VNLPPVEVSLIERAGLRFTDHSHGRYVIRRREPTPSRAKVVLLQLQDGEGAGPILVDGVPLSETRLAGGESWTTGWSYHNAALGLAMALGARLQEA